MYEDRFEPLSVQAKRDLIIFGEGSAGEKILGGYLYDLQRSPAKRATYAGRWYEAANLLCDNQIFHVVFGELISVGPGGPFLPRTLERTDRPLHHLFGRHEIVVHQ